MELKGGADGWVGNKRARGQSILGKRGATMILPLVRPLCFCFSVVVVAKACCLLFFVVVALHVAHSSFSFVSSGSSSERCSYYLRFFHVVSACLPSQCSHPPLIPHSPPSLFPFFFVFAFLRVMIYVCELLMSVCVCVGHLISSAAISPPFRFLVGFSGWIMGFLIGTSLLRSFFERF